MCSRARSQDKFPSEQVLPPSDKPALPAPVTARPAPSKPTYTHPTHSTSTYDHSSWKDGGPVRSFVGPFCGASPFSGTWERRGGRDTGLLLPRNVRPDLFPFREKRLCSHQAAASPGNYHLPSKPRSNEQHEQVTPSGGVIDTFFPSLFSFHHKFSLLTRTTTMIFQ